MASLETLLSQYWMVIFAALIVLLVVLVFLVRVVSNKKKGKSGIPEVKSKEKISLFSKEKTTAQEIKKEEVKPQVFEPASTPVPEAVYETPKIQERKKINTWADFIIEIDNLSNSLVDAKSHEYFKMSQMYRDLTRFYFDNIQNPNIEKSDMDTAWKKLEACYSRIQKLLENI
ncbi:MAG: hypothetical protein APG12_01233 [Candidatus Methanofastidiosum methylothiophilum]|uniref:Uncharacterized protein n=1 Tax=Candidatus Methanofastidiosum methylothiophilum TaxID=1705564 RepID=A0A150IXZ0_9EURY|nr:MAG: hypothetical protein APG10_01030 [Candidatus Methanofastidiosum methylthiophilus]KYC47324.1 MAG: hypothetical protein APG11_01228 [Candidatus Methanofastidiosum methylthiophilus]KYC49775.1 MAG: hypothetical protein APG12_01233 [Candidatus Methanofastidiosum methylthiophilus]